ncbi:permease [Tsukamurella soli]|uniref:permease n=1 Tax=Tsukamurella soli TaxID=644556 RepID=UPI0031E5354B
MTSELPTTLRARLALGAATAREDLVEAGSFLALGAAFAAALHVLVPQDWYRNLAGNMLPAGVVMVALAIVLALCSEADAFVTASTSALPLMPRIVFLVVGPAVDVELMTMQAGTDGRGFVARFAPLALLVTVVCGTAAGTAILGWR